MARLTLALESKLIRILSSPFGSMKFYNPLPEHNEQYGTRDFS